MYHYRCYYTRRTQHESAPARTLRSSVHRGFFVSARFSFAASGVSSAASAFFPSPNTSASVSSTHVANVSVISSDDHERAGSDSGAVDSGASVAAVEAKVSARSRFATLDAAVVAAATLPPTPILDAVVAVAADAAVEAKVSARSRFATMDRASSPPPSSRDSDADPFFSSVPRDSFPERNPHAPSLLRARVSLSFAAAAVFFARSARSFAAAADFAVPGPGKFGNRSSDATGASG